MHLFSAKGIIKKYKTANDIISEFVDTRLDMYGKRKAHIIKTLEQTSLILKNKIRFIGEVTSKTFKLITVPPRKEDSIISELVEKKYKKVKGNFDYLINLPIKTFTYEKINELKDEAAKLEEKLKTLSETTVSDLWLGELKNL